jgi:hypothetical protein
MGLPRNVIGWPLLLLTACAAYHTGEQRPETITPALDRFFNRGDIQVAGMRLRDFGFDPGPVDRTFTAQTQAAVRAFQVAYGLPVSGLLDRPTRRELRLVVDPKRGD